MHRYKMCMCLTLDGLSVTQLRSASTFRCCDWIVWFLLKLFDFYTWLSHKKMDFGSLDHPHQIKINNKAFVCVCMCKHDESPQAVQTQSKSAIIGQHEHSRGWLNMDQGHPINNQTVKFIISCCVVSKQVEVSTILVSVESTGSWLHAGTCPVFVH